MKPSSVFRLVAEDPQRTLSLVLSPGSNSLGSDPSNRLVLTDAGVSRRQATLVVEGDSVLVIDRQSKNGTYIDGRPISSAELLPGETVAFGPVELRLERVAKDDVELGLALAAPESGPRTAAGTTAFAQPPKDPRLDYWLGLIRRFTTTLAERGAGAALGMAQDELGCSALALLDPHSGTVLAACGDTRNLARRETTEKSLDRRQRFRTSADSTHYFDAIDGGFVELVALGDFPYRESSEELFSTLLTLCLVLSQEPAVGVSWGAHRALPLTFPPGYIAGASPALEALHGELHSASQSHLPTLIMGETGTGKELTARTLHLSSPRRHQPFVVINCAAIPHELLEAELFGIGDRVATGVAARRGKFEEANGGTLFLDEIGDTPAALQAKLLRALQEQRIEPLGRPSRAIDVRLVAATNADLADLMKRGEFRRDLYYRLAGIVLRLPPLRDRREDIPLLIQTFLQRTTEDLGKPILGVTVAALNRLLAHDWPGNIRQLEHEVQRLAHHCPAAEAITLAMVSPELREGQEHPPEATAPTSDETPSAAASENTSPDLDLEALEREAILRAMRRTRGNQVAAAKLLGLSRHQLRRRLARHGIDKL
ncbi:MAG: sigma 54-interacting transcriptional regulator [Acidobacteriota bacterium]